MPRVERERERELLDRLQFGFVNLHGGDLVFIYPLERAKISETS
jgi:hypothetical protein